MAGMTDKLTGCKNYAIGDEGSLKRGFVTSWSTTDVIYGLASIEVSNNVHHITGMGMSHRMAYREGQVTKKVYMKGSIYSLPIAS